MKRSISRLLNRLLPRSGLAKSVSVLAGGTALAQAIGVAASPILTRIYKPADFGALQIFVSLMMFAVIAAGGQYEVAILLPEDEQSSVDILGLAVLCVCLTTTITAVIVLICHYHWILPVSMLALKGHLWLFPISVLGAGLYQALSYWAMRHGGYSQIAKSKFTRTGAQIATQLSVGLLIHGSFGLLLGDAIGRITGSGRFIHELWRKSSNQLRAIRFSRMIELAIRYRAYPLVSMWSSLISLSGGSLLTLFIAQYYGTQGTGWIALVGRVLSVPSELVGLSISQVYTAEAAKLSRSDPKRLMYIFLKTTRRMLYLGIVPCVLFAIAAPRLFQLVFGDAWREAGIYARYLAFMFYAGFINSPVQVTLKVLERQRAQLTWDISRLALIVASIALPYYRGYGPRIAILCFGVSMTFMYGVHWIQSYFAIKHRVKQADVALINAVQA